MEIGYSTNRLAGVTMGNELSSNMTQLLTFANEFAICKRE